MRFTQRCVGRGAGENGTIYRVLRSGSKGIQYLQARGGQVLYRRGAPGYASTLAQLQASPFGGAYYMKTYSKPALKKHAALKQVTFSSH